MNVKREWLLDDRKDSTLGKGWLRRQIPPVGKRITRAPYTGKDDDSSRPLWGEVKFVNYEHLFFRVEFQGGLRECYKVPEVKL